MIRIVVRRLDELLRNDCFNINRQTEDILIPKPFKEQMEMYVQHLKDAGKKDLTVKNYMENGVRFLNCVLSYGVTNLADIEVKHILKAFEDNSPKTNFYSVGKSLMKYAYEMGIKDTDLSMFVPKPQIPKPIPSTYTKDETERMLNVIDRSTWIGKRNYAIVLIALRLGMRASDIVSLKKQNIDFRTKTINFVQVKTGQPHQLALLPDVELALLDYLNKLDYLDERCKNLSVIFFTSRTPYSSLSTMLVYSIVEKSLKQANIETSGKKRGPHSLRMTLASELVAEGVPYAAVQRILGHDDPDSTKYYVKFDIEKLRSCSLYVPPLSGNAARILCLQPGGVK